MAHAMTSCCKLTLLVAACGAVDYVFKFLNGVTVTSRGYIYMTETSTEVSR